MLDEVFSSLARQPSCQEAILSDFASLAVKVLRPISETGVATGMVAAILDIWTNVVLNFPSPLPLATVEVVFPSVVSAVLKVDDSAILQVWSCSPTLMFCVLVLFTCLEWRRLFEGVPDKRGGAVGGVVYNHGGKWFATVCEDYTPLVGSQPVRVLMFISGSFSHRAHQAGGNTNMCRFIAFCLDSAPCSLDSAPCSLDSAPCSLDSAPCGLDSVSCSLDYAISLCTM